MIQIVFIVRKRTAIIWALININLSSFVNIWDLEPLQLFIITPMFNTVVSADVEFVTGNEYVYHILHCFSGLMCITKHCDCTLWINIYLRHFPLQLLNVWQQWSCFSLFKFHNIFFADDWTWISHIYFQREELLRFCTQAFTCGSSSSSEINLKIS